MLSLSRSRRCFPLLFDLTAGSPPFFAYFFFHPLPAAGTFPQFSPIFSRGSRRACLCTFSFAREIPLLSSSFPPKVPTLTPRHSSPLVFDSMVSRFSSTGGAARNFLVQLKLFPFFLKHFIPDFSRRQTGLEPPYTESPTFSFLGGPFPSSLLSLIVPSFFW